MKRADFYTARCITVEARQLVGAPTEWHETYKWVEENTEGSFDPNLNLLELGAPKTGVSIDPGSGRTMILNKEGLFWANPGDFIVRKGEDQFFVYSPALFSAEFVSSGLGEPEDYDGNEFTTVAMLSTGETISMRVSGWTTVEQAVEALVLLTDVGVVTEVAKRWNAEMDR